MKITVIALGNKMPLWVEMAAQDYLKRFPRSYPVDLKEIKAVKRSTASNIKALLKEEEQKIKAVLPKNNLLISLDEKGQKVSSMEIAHYLATWDKEQKSPSFVIGSSDGLSADLKQSSALILKLSDLTLPHALARILLLEQLYRAISIIHHHPYHRE